MNKKYYITKAGNVIVLDENNNSREFDKNSKYKERLIQENIIETIENRIKKLEEILEKYPMEKIKKFIPLATIITTISSLLTLLINCVLMINKAVYIENFFEAFNILNESFSFMFPLMLLTSLLGVIIDIARYSDYNEYIQKLNADNLELETLKRILPKEREKLNKLNLDKSKSNTKYKANFLYQVGDQQQLNDLSEYMKSYRTLGRILSKLYEAYQNNTLKELLREYGFNLNKEEYEILLNYIKEKGPSVVSNKKMKKRSKKL